MKTVSTTRPLTAPPAPALAPSRGFGTTADARPLAPPVQRSAEGAPGHDFGTVAVHADAHAPGPHLTPAGASHLPIQRLAADGAGPIQRDPDDEPRAPRWSFGQGVAQGFFGFPQRQATGFSQTLALMGLRGGQAQAAALHENRMAARGAGSLARAAVDPDARQDVADAYHALPDDARDQVHEGAAQVGGQFAGGVGASLLARRAMRPAFHEMFASLPRTAARAGMLAARSSRVAGLMMLGFNAQSAIRSGVEQRRMVDRMGGAPFTDPVFGPDTEAPRRRDED